MGTEKDRLLDRFPAPSVAPVARRVPVTDVPQYNCTVALAAKFVPVNTLFAIGIPPNGGNPMVGP